MAALSLNAVKARDPKNSSFCPKLVRVGSIHQPWRLPWATRAARKSPTKSWALKVILYWYSCVISTNAANARNMKIIRVGWCRVATIPPRKAKCAATKIFGARGRF